jgi:hypothetical protein
MKRICTITILTFIVTLILGFPGNNLFSADQNSLKAPPPVPDTDLSVSPFKGPADAPVKIVVFTCFQ